MPVAREERQNTKLMYNEDGNAFIARIPKPLKGEVLNYKTLEIWSRGLIERIVNEMHQGEFGPDRETRRIVKFFKMKQRK